MARLRRQKRRTAGFRFSTTDAIAIVICLVITIVGYAEFGALAFLPMIVLGHFFLFCNIFRIHRTYELIWAFVFILNFAVWFLLIRGDMSMARRVLWLLVCQIPVTAFLIGLEMRSANYHGIFSRRINSRLEEYLAGDEQS